MTTNPTKIEKSHLNIIKKVIPIDNITDESVLDTLNKLRTNKGAELSQNYKISILRTIKKFNKKVGKRPQYLKLKSNRNNNIEDDHFKEILMNIIQYIYTQTMNDINILETRSMIDTHIAILLITSCHINIKDIFTIRNEHLNTLTNREPINISKKINIIPKLFIKAEPIIRELMKHRNTLYKDHTIYGKLVTCTPDIINKTIKELYTEFNAIKHIKSKSNLGLHKFKFKNSDIIYRYIYGDGLY